MSKDALHYGQDNFKTHTNEKKETCIKKLNVLLSIFHVHKLTWLFLFLFI